MSEVKTIATRESYGKTLVALGAENPDIVVLDADLAGSTKTGMFAKAYPERHINCGIAEGNMMSVAAGLAASGLYLHLLLPCSHQDVHMNRFVILSDTHT